MTFRYAHSLSLLVGLLLLAVVSPAVAQTDYDTDNNGLIEISSLAQLHAMRWDLNGDGALDTSADTTAYREAFSTPMSGMGCPNTGCTGYELMADLTFDVSDTSHTPWKPIGTGSAPFNTTFDGLGNTLTGMSTNDPSDRTGLFGVVDRSGIIRNLGVINASIRLDGDVIATGRSIGILAGENRGTISACYAQGGTIYVSLNTGVNAGGLIGFNPGGTIRASYSTAAVAITAENRVQTTVNVAGLVAYLWRGEIIASYAAGSISGAPAATRSTRGGFVGSVWFRESRIRHSYCDTTAVVDLAPDQRRACIGGFGPGAISDSVSVPGKTSGDLQSPGGYTGIYANWNIDLDGVTGTDDPWDFGTANQYPVLKVGRDAATIAAQFAAQLPGRPQGVTVTDQLGGLRVTWTAVTGVDGYKVQWKSGDQAYDALTREYAVGGTDTTIVGLTGGTTYTVRVIATRTNAEDRPPSSEATGMALAIPMLTITSPSVAEGAAGATDTLHFAVTLSHAIPNAVTVAYADARTGSATSGTDYTALTAGTLTIAADVLSDTLAVAVMGDGMDEPDETVEITLHSPTNATFAAGAGALIGTGTITDDDSAVATLVLSPASISENGGVATVTAILSSAVSAEVTITVSAAGDFTLSSPATLTIAVGQTTSTGVVTITANDNMVSAATQLVTVSGAANTVADPVDVTLMITDDDTPQVTLALSSASISENGGVSTVTATLSRAVSEAATTITVSAMGDDFTLSTPATLTIAANGTTSTGLVTITARDNTLDAENKRVTVSGTVTGGKNATAPPAVTLTITDDDAPPTLSIDPPRAAAEGDLGSAPLQFRVRLSAPSERQITVAYADAGTGSATSGEDYTALAAGTLTFAPGTTSQTFSVSVTGDRLDEPDETVVITLTSPTNATFAGGAQDLDVTGTITDDDPAVATLVLSPASISENGGIATVSATLSTPESAETTITVSVTEVAPAVDGDFSVSSAKTLTIAANGTTSTGVVTITAVNNAVNALDKQVTVSGTVDAAAANTVVGPADAILTITDDDYAPRGVAVTPDADILTVTWDAIIGATGYKVQWKSGTQNYPAADLARSTHGQATIFSGTVTSHNITGLTFGQAYTVRVITTRTNLADSSPSAEVTHTPVLPTPTGVGVMAGVDTLTVTWAAVSDASGYRVQWKSGNLAYPTTLSQSASRGQDTVSVSSTPIYKISGLTMGTVYAIRVIATHSSATGNSAPSDEVTATLASTSRPTNVRVTPGDRQLLVTWDAMTGATGYKVEWKSGNLAYPTTLSQSASRGQDTTSAGTTYTIANLTNGTAYTVRVIAQTGMTDSTPSSEVMGTPQPLDYDKDDNGYIEIWSLAQFDAIRHDPNGTGNASHAAYGAAFPGAAQGMGCPSSRCQGYELMTDLDFDENDDDTITAVDATYWNGGAGWIPIARYSATFKGNNQTISNLYIRRARNSEDTGLFGRLGALADISGLGLKNVDIRAGRYVGGLAGYVIGTPLPRITACYTTGRVQGYEEVGGLVGRLFNGIIAASYSTANIEGDRTATSNLSQFGGLVGFIHEETSSIVASYATGSVDAGTSARDSNTGKLLIIKAKAGGLVGLNLNHLEDRSPIENPQSARIIASYATGRVIGDIPPNDSAGGLVGRSLDRGTDSYWDTETTGQDNSDSGTGKTTVQLRSPTSYTSTAGNTSAIYANWNVDVDGVPGNDDPWFFGTAGQYPVLKYAGMDIAAQLAAQLPGVPQGVTLTPSLDTLIVRWSPVTNATGYKVQWKSGRQNYAASRQASVTDTSSKILGLVEGTLYTVRVIATKTGARDGLPSAEVTGSFFLKVRGVTLTPNLDTLIVRWNAMQNATSYKVQWKSGGESYPVADQQASTHGQATVSGVTTTYTIAMLTTGTLYTVRVIAILQGMTDSDPSAEVMGVPGIRYDRDGDGYIDIGTLAQLNAMRWDLDGNGAVATSDTMNYNAAFPNAASRMGCPSNRCTGYELMTDLDFDENNDNQITAADTTYWNSGEGWLPIGAYTGRFKGNNQTVSNLFISRASTHRVGLFREVSGDISGLGLKNVNVTGQNDVGGLAGHQSGGRITACYVTGRVEGRGQYVGGLVGYSIGSAFNKTAIAASYTIAEVYHLGAPTSPSAGGLVGHSIHLDVIASYAIGSVTSNGERVGGLIGELYGLGSVTASYATETVTGTAYTGGLIGRGSGSVADSYWDMERSGQPTSAGGTGKTTVQLQSPTSYTSTAGNTEAIYANWNVNVDGVPGNDDPWTFGASDQYPVLKYAGMDTTAQYVAQPLGVPQGVTLTTSLDTLIVRWSPVSSATGYKVQWKSGEENYAASRQASVTDTSSKISGLAVGTTYTVRVIATKTGAADGLPSAEVTGSLVEGAKNVRVTSGVDSLIVTWDAVSGANGYRVQWKSGAENYPIANRQGNTYGQATVSSGDTTTYTIENLIAGTLYTVRVITTKTGAPDALSAEVLGSPGIRYDSDGNGLIEIGTLAQLNAMRWDLDGNGAVADSDTMNYNAAFPNAVAGMGCPSRCLGYELMADLDFDENNDNRITAADTTYWNSGNGWVPIGSRTARFNATFDGDGHIIENLFINRSTADVGLFGATGTSARILALGLVNVSVTGSSTPGALVGQNQGRIAAVYASGAVQGTDVVGGLVGATNTTSSAIVASYATASVTITGATGGGAGLVGYNNTGSVIRASYSTGAVTGGTAREGFLRGNRTAVAASYWDSESSGIDDDNDADAPEGKTTVQLQSPTSYTSTAGNTSAIYANWNVDVDGVPGNDDPWLFGASDQYPVLKYAGMDTSAQFAAQFAPQGVTLTPNLDTLIVRWNAVRNATGYKVQWKSGGESYPATDQQASTHGQATVSVGSDTTYAIANLTNGTSYTVRVIAILQDMTDSDPSDEVMGVPGIRYDRDGNGLIEIGTLAQLNAMRWDLDGNGAVATSDTMNYNAAFPNAASRMGCLPTGCTGYELATNLTFPASGDYSTWSPINNFNTTLEGNGRTLTDLNVNPITNTNADLGLFGSLGGSAVIRNLGLVNPTVVSSTSNPQSHGIVAGYAPSGDTISAVYILGGSITTAANTSNAGGLVGFGSITIQGSYSTASVRVSGNPTGVDIGGLVGDLSGGSIIASYATGTVSGGTGSIGGLVGKASGGTITASYCDTVATIQSSCIGSGTTVPGKSTTQLQTPTGYTGIYMDWNLDLDGLSGKDDPWTFGTSYQYPVLKYAGMDTTAQFAAQPRGVPRGVTLTPNLDTLIVRWSPVSSATGYKVRWKSGGQSYPPADHLGNTRGQARVSNTTTYAIANLTNGTPYTVSVIAILQDMTDGDPSDEVMGVPGIRYDSDGNGYIEIGTLAQLHAMRWDLNGDGAVDASASTTDSTAYVTAFPSATAGMDCPSLNCLGYELMADLDFDENNDNQITVADTTYWNSGEGWLPIGTYTGRFKGNNQTISNLFISRAATDRVGLFREVTGDISGLGLKNVNVRGKGRVGGLVGHQNRGRITACYVTGRVEGQLQVGGGGGGLMGYLLSGACRHRGLLCHC